MTAVGARIVVDAMGGDYAPEVNIKGTLMALEEAGDFSTILVGNRDLLLDQLRLHKAKENDRLKVVHADEIISMEDHGATAIRKKKNSSINVGLRLVREKEGDAFISAGNSGAVMAGALLVLGRLADVERPAIVVRLPTAEGYIIILDVGANVDCRPSHLVQFAEMGHIYAKVIEEMESPRIALLSNGSETHKGNDLTRATHEILVQRKDIQYLGYVEGYDLFRDRADVVICDGFVGNVILKLAEGLADTAMQWFRKQVKHSVRGLVGAAFMKGILQKFKNTFDYEPYGAAPLLGIDGMVLISHGASTEIAIRNGILMAKRGVESQFTKKIAEYFEKHRNKKTESSQGEP